MIRMRWRAINFVLAPVFTLMLVCSMAKLQLDTPQLAKKLTSACPFHPGMTIEVEEEDGTVASSQAPKHCFNCLTESILIERSDELNRSATLQLLFPKASRLVPDAFAEPVVLLAAAFPFASGPPPDGALPLRI
jgi:hypothetical protein